jgi:hypothetical protein
VTGPFYSNASKAPRVRPGDLPGSIGVSASPDHYMPIGIASNVGRIGGYDWQADRSLGPVEAVWSLAIGKEDVEERFVLRAGRFVELAEGAR